MKYCVSVVIPVYNVEKTLRRAVDSVIAQTLQDLEIILVDDGSKDGSPDICDEYARKYQNIRVVHKNNGGLGSACNAGIEAATGEFIAFLDSDDWLDKEAYETMYNEAKDNDAEIVFTGLKRIDSESQISYMHHPQKREVLNTREEIHRLMKDMIASSPEIPAERPIQMSAKVVLYRMDIIKKHNIRFENERKFGSEDLLFNLDYLKHATKAIILPDYFYYYFVNTSSLTHTVKDDAFDKYKTLYHELFNRYPELMPDMDQRDARMLIGYVRSYLMLLFTADNPEKKKKELFYNISNDRIWESINRRYPINKMNKPKRIMHSLLMHKQFLLYKFAVTLYTYRNKN